MFRLIINILTILVKHVAVLYFAYNVWFTSNKSQSRVIIYQRLMIGMLHHLLNLLLIFPLSFSYILCGVREYYTNSSKAFF